MFEVEEKTALLLATTELYKDRDKFVAVAFRYVRNLEKARDLVSDSFASLLERKEYLPEDPLKLGIYLMQTVKHKCLNELKHEAVVRGHQRENLARMDRELLSDDSVTEYIMGKEVSGLFAKAASGMSRLSIDIYASSRIKGLSHKEISQQFGISPNRVAKEIMKVSRILETLVRNYLKIFIIVIPTAAILLSIFR